MLIVRSVCTGSADGHCQAIDVFTRAGGRPVWHRQYTDVLNIHPLANGFLLQTANYRPQDPLCCPTGEPETEVYVWSGRAFVRQDQVSGR
jgi:hypothetical protein